MIAVNPVLRGVSGGNRRLEPDSQTDLSHDTIRCRFLTGREPWIDIAFTAEEGGLPCLGYIVDQVALRVAMTECALGQGLEVNWTRDG